MGQEQRPAFPADGLFIALNVLARRVNFCRTLGIWWLESSTSLALISGVGELTKLVVSITRTPPRSALRRVVECDYVYYELSSIKYTP